MTPATTQTKVLGAAAAYDALAHAYDAMVADYGHDVWLERLLGLAAEHGLRGRRALDVACGTGASFLPLLDRGYAVTGVDISPEMCARATINAAGRADVHVGDARDLPDLGEFDLVTCLDDALNYLLDPADLADAFASVERQLAPGGLFVFDLTSLSSHRRAWSESFTISVGPHIIQHEGLGDPDLPPGGLTSAKVTVLTGPEGTVTSAVHHQRNHPIDEVRALLDAAGLELVALRGQHQGAVLDTRATEEHHKLVFLARRRGV